MSALAKHVRALGSAIRHLVRPRMTVRYPEAFLTNLATNYAFDPKRGAGLSGWRGRHLLYLDKCTGCSLCYIACENIAQAIEMVPLPEERRAQNKKGIYPAVDYGRCVFCGFCVDACPFYALEMTPDQELSEFDRGHLYYTPYELAVPPKAPSSPYVQPKLRQGSMVHEREG